MTERERLRKLINVFIDCEDYKSEDIIDYLLDNGVIVPPCKIGDFDTPVWDISEGKIVRYSIYKVSICYYGSKQIFLLNTKREKIVGFEDFGKTVFLSRKDAAKALKELENEKRNL